MAKKKKKELLAFFIYSFHLTALFSSWYVLDTFADLTIIRIHGLSHVRWVKGITLKGGVPRNPPSWEVQAPPPSQGGFYQNLP
jgi:hypothetical protein